MNKKQDAQKKSRKRPKSGFEIIKNLTITIKNGEHRKMESHHITKLTPVLKEDNLGTVTFKITCKFFFFREEM